MEGIHSSAPALYWLAPAQVLFLLIQISGIACFYYVVKKRLAPMLAAEHDFRFDRPLQRMEKLLQFWLGQWKHPRYPAPAYCTF